MFEIWMNDGKTEMPDDDIFYIVAKDGIYLKKSLGHFNTISKVDNISTLGECESFASLNIAKIKARQFTQILSLFREVYKKYHAECNAILHYNKKRKRWRVDIPPQGVSGASVEYENGLETYKDYMRIGTIHSHANMSAFHSGTDHGDEENWDGLHITLGKMGEDYFEISCSIMSSGERFMVNPEDYIEGIELVEYEVQRSYTSYQWVNGKQVERPLEKKLGYTSTAPEKDYKFPLKWIKQVDKYRPKPVVNKWAGRWAGKDRWSSKYGSFGHNAYGLYGGNYNESFYDYTPPKAGQTQHGLTEGQKNLFSDLHIDEDEWNACSQCPYKDHKKKDLLMELINEATEEDLAELGLFFIAESDAEQDVKDNSFYVNENPDQNDPNLEVKK